MSDLFRLDQAVAVVTGACGKLGPIWVDALLDAGARVAALDLPSATPSERYQQIERAAGDRLRRIECDITRRDSIERAVPAAIDKDILERLAATSHDILYVFNLPDQSLVYVNERVRAVLGYEVHEIPGAGELFRPLVHRADLSTFDEHYRSLAALPDKTVRSVEYRVRRADGHALG